MRLRPGLALSIVLALALLLRVVAVLRVADRPLRGDELSYDEIAWNVAQGHGYAGRHEAPYVPTAMRGPGYVLPLALAYRAAGHAKLPMLLAQALLDTLVVALVWRIARRTFDDPAVALVAAGLYAFYPPFVLMPSELLTETIVNAAFLGAVACWTESRTAPRRGLTVAAGLCVGVVALSKPQLAPVAVLFALVVHPLRSRAFWREAALQVLVVSLVLAPWIVRNALVFHAFVPGVTNGGITFWGGAGPDHGHTLSSLGDPGVPRNVFDTVIPMSERDRDRWLYAEGARLVRAHPLHYLRLCGARVVQLWFSLLYDRARPSLASAAVALANSAAFVFAWIGARRMRPLPEAARLVVALVAWFTLVHAPLCAVVRYAFPALALVFVFAAAGLVSLARPQAPR